MNALEGQVAIVTGGGSGIGRSAETFWIEEIVDPRDTRPLLCEFANLSAPLRHAGASTHKMRP